MFTASETLRLIKSRGGRITSARTSIVKLLYNKKSPLSAHDILDGLGKKGIHINKTTAYREILYLLQQGLIRKVKLSDRKLHYESLGLVHHHHLVCSDCGSIEEIVCDELETPIKKFVKRISDSGFDVENHELDFFGKCAICK